MISQFLKDFARDFYKYVYRLCITEVFMLYLIWQKLYNNGFLIKSFRQHQIVFVLTNQIFGKKSYVGKLLVKLEKNTLRFPNLPQYFFSNITIFEIDLKLNLNFLRLLLWRISHHNCLIISGVSIILKSTSVKKATNGRHFLQVLPS